MSDRLAVLNHGLVEQIGSPDEIYERPATAFVAGFVGVSNVVEADLARRLTGTPAPFTLRPEKIRLADPAGAPGDALEATAAGVIESTVYLGAATRYTVTLDGGGQLLVVRQNAGDPGRAWAAGQRVRLGWARQHQQPLG